MPADTKKMLSDMIRSVGKELIDKADEITGDPVGPWLNYNIVIHIQTDTDEFNVPTIQVSRTFVSDYATQSKLNYYNRIGEDD